MRSTDYVQIMCRVVFLSFLVHLNKSIKLKLCVDTRNIPKLATYVFKNDVGSALSVGISIGKYICDSIFCSLTSNFKGTLSTSVSPSVAYGKDKIYWKKVDLPIKETLFDISFDPTKQNHGWLVGSKGTFFETFDGGDTWNTRLFNSLDNDEDINYRFEITSMSDNEGWIIGKPAIMLHTRDGGKQFERIPLSPKLPGEPIGIISTGPSKVEMITSQGAVYTSSNGGLNWKSLVKETIDATLNRVSSSGTSGASFFTGKIANQIRDINGNYIAIASRGNLFLTWSPGQDYWIPHNRGSSRRIQNMGFIGKRIYHTNTYTVIIYLPCRK